MYETIAISAVLCTNILYLFTWPSGTSIQTFSQIRQDDDVTNITVAEFVFLMLETVKSYIQFIKNEKKLLDEQRSKVQEEAGVEDDGIESLGSNRWQNF